MLTRLSNVTVGQKIKIGSDVYKVEEYTYRGILLAKEVLPSIYASPQNASEIFEDYQGAMGHLVEVIEEDSTLTSSFRTQLKKQSLTESLRAQIEEDEYDEEEEDDDWDEDWGEEDEEDEEDEENEEDDDWDEETFKFAWDKESSELPGARKISLVSDFANQISSNESKQARLEAAFAKKIARTSQDTANKALSSVGQVSESLITLNDSIWELKHDMYDRTEDAQEVAGHAQDVAYQAIGRVSKIEEKLFEEEKNVSLEHELNQKLALQKKLNESIKSKKSGGNGPMKNVFAGIKQQFGKVEGKFAFSPVTGGLALRKDLTDSFVAYDKGTKEITDVSGLTLKFNVPAFKLPVAAEQVSVGDIIIHNAEYVYVTKKADGYLETINPEKGVKGSVIPTKNAILGAAFYTVVKTIDAAGEGGFNPMLLAALGDGNNDELVKIMALTGGFGGAGKEIDPMMFALIGDKTDDLLPLILMQQGGAIAGKGMESILPFLLMGEKGDKKDLLPILAMTGGFGGAEGGFNPMMFALLGDGEVDVTTMAMMGAFGGNGLFGQSTAEKKEVKAPEAE